jgi:hypothetical protein
VIGGGILTLAVVGVTAWLVPSLRSLDIERATPTEGPRTTRDGVALKGVADDPG